jgi:uncharacterized protein YndB with AHSA1/START domain
MTPEPVIKSLVVALDPPSAFELFTTGLARWWPLATHSCAGAAARDVTIEPRVGGRVVEHADDGSTAPWGTVLAWEPPHRFAMTWHPQADPVQATRLEVRFSAAHERGCRVELVHDGWQVRGDAAAAVRERYDGGWVEVLQRYAIAAEPAHLETP